MEHYIYVPQKHTETQKSLKDRVFREFNPDVISITVPAKQNKKQLLLQKDDQEKCEEFCYMRTYGTDYCMVEDS